MPAYIEMPKLSDTMTEGTLVKWHKAVGDQVEIGDVLADVETDKAVMDLEAFDEGILSELYVQDGDKAQLGQRLALLLAPGESPPAKTDEVVSEKKPAAPVVEEKSADVSPQPTEKTAKPTVTTIGRVKASPYAKKLAAAQNVTLESLRGSGPGGRVVAQDVIAASSAAKKEAASSTDSKDRLIPLSGMRKTVADRLLLSKTQIPHFYLHMEVDAAALLKLRAELNTYLSNAGSEKLSINDFVLKAAVEAAVKVPRVNASFAGDAIREYGDVHLSVAVAVEDGLITPVIRKAQQKSLREISKEIKELAERARNKKLTPAEYQGGTITVTNLGPYGIDHFSAIINPPQAMILSVGALVKKPVVNDRDEMVVGQRMSIGLSADHRVVDGAVGAQFLAEVRQFLEHPAYLMMDLS